MMTRFMSNSCASQYSPDLPPPRYPCRMSFRRFALGSFLFPIGGVLVVLASAGGCSDNTTPTPRAFIDSHMAVGPQAPAQVCGITEPEWVGVGTADSKGFVQTSVNDGDSQDGKQVSVNCSVTANSDGSFQVNASVTLASTGSVTINAKVTGSGQQTGVHGVFQRSDFGRFDENDCTIDFTRVSGMGVAAGRVWGDLDCPHASDPSQPRPNPDGGSEEVAHACEGTAEFRFENCGQ